MKVGAKVKKIKELVKNQIIKDKCQRKISLLLLLPFLFGVIYLNVSLNKIIVLVDYEKMLIKQGTTF